ncbi:MAG: PIN domain-containing protein [Thermoanaerobaculia bacterium]
MIAYLDSSVVLRLVLGQGNALGEWRRVARGVASALVEVECLRTLDRLCIVEDLSEAEIARRREAVFLLLETIEIVDLTRPVLDRAAQPLPTTLGTLDAIHLATAMLWRDANNADLVLATHDQSLALAARASGLRTVGT